MWKEVTQANNTGAAWTDAFWALTLPNCEATAAGQGEAERGALPSIPRSLRRNYRKKVMSS